MIIDLIRLLTIRGDGFRSIIATLFVRKMNQLTVSLTLELLSRRRRTLVSGKLLC